MLNTSNITERIKQREREWANSAGPGYITGLMELWLKVLNGPRRIVELGTYSGNSAFAWLACPNTTVTSVDTNQGDGATVSLLEDIERYGWQGRASLVKSDSVAYAESYEIQADMVYVDTTHEYLQTRREIEAWLPHIKPEGYLVLDDMVGYPEVLKAFQYCLEVSCKDRIGWFMGYTDTYTPKNHGILVARIR